MVASRRRVGGTCVCVCVCIYIYIPSYTHIYSAPCIYRTQLHVPMYYRTKLHVHHPRVEVRDEHATVKLLPHDSAQDVANFVPLLLLVEVLSGSGGSCFL